MAALRGSHWNTTRLGEAPALASSCLHASRSLTITNQCCSCTEDFFQKEKQQSVICAQSSSHSFVSSTRPPFSSAYWNLLLSCLLCSSSYATLLEFQEHHESLARRHGRRRATRDAAVAGGGQQEEVFNGRRGAIRTGARVVQEVQQKADLSGKGVQTELIKVLSRLVRVDAREIADLTGPLHHTYLFAEDSPLAKIDLEAGKSYNRRAHRRSRKGPSATTRRAWRTSCRYGAR